MNIIFYRHSLRNRGGDFMILQQANHLAEQGHQVTLYANEFSSQFPLSSTIKCKNIPYPGVVGTLFYLLTHRFKADHVVVDLVLLALMGLCRNGNTMMYYAQDHDESYYRSWWKRMVTRLAYHCYLKVFSKPTIVASDHLCQELQEQFQCDHCNVVSHGIDTVFWKKNGESRPDQDQRVIVVFARADHRKGLDVALDTLKRLAKARDRDDWEVWFVGPQESVSIEGVASRTLGLLNQQELRATLQQADIFLSPVRHEGFGLLQLQAMACGCAMVTTDAFRLVTHEYNALVAPNEDSARLAGHLNRVLDDQGLRDELQCNAVALAQQYDIRQSCEGFERVFNER